MGSSSRGGWQRLSLKLERSALAAAEDMLLEAGAVTISIADAGDVPLLEPAPGETPLWPLATLSALFASAADLGPIAALTAARFGIAARVERLEDADWAAQPSEIAPIEVGRRLLVGPPDTPARSGRRLLELHQGLAFGTGSHPTTELCLEWLEREIVAGMRVLDYGCGSGILGLAALALGAERVWAVDLEPQALTATRENAELNDLASRIWIGLPEALPALEADVVVANILARPLIELAATLAARLRPGGMIVLSGILSEQCAELERTYGAWIGAFERSDRAGWSSIAGRRAVAATV